jgi:hypothetical protein
MHGSTLADRAKQARIPADAEVSKLEAFFGK